MVEKVEKALGPITVLVNNAGGDIALRGGKPKPNNGLGVPMEDVRAIFVLGMEVAAKNRLRTERWRLGHCARSSFFGV